MMYINCPEGADLIEFDKRKREWLLYDSVKVFEDTFRAVIDAKNEALVRPQQPALLLRLTLRGFRQGFGEAC